MTGTTSRDAKRGAVAFRVLTAFVLLLLFTSSVGRAQVPGPLETDANCNPAAYDDMQQFQAEVCASHAGCALTLKIMQTQCKAKAFLGKIGNFFSPASSSAELTSEDVLEASLPNVPSTPITRRAISNARAAVTRRDPPQTSMSYNSASTTATYSEGSLTPNGQPDGPAVSLASNGVGSSGTWTNGQLNGPGLIKDSKDVVVAGYFRDSSLQGEGFRYAEDKVLIEGTYLNGQPDGMMNVVYADGATQKKLYKNGAILAEGPRAPKGQLAQDAVYRSPEMIAAEQEAAYSSKLKTATAGSLYAMADESLAGGDSEHGRRALRELLTRFPDSSLAAKAADRLASIGNTQQAAQPTARSASPGPSSPVQSSSGSQESLARRYAGRGLPAAECTRQMNASGYAEKLERLRGTNPDNNPLLLRGAIANIDVMLAIGRQCLPDPIAKQFIQEYTDIRAQTLVTCRQISSSDNCEVAPF